MLLATSYTKQMRAGLTQRLSDSVHKELKPKENHLVLANSYRKLSGSFPFFQTENLVTFSN